MIHDFGILVHGGTGDRTLANKSSKRTNDIRGSLESAAALGYRSLTSIKNEGVNPTAVLDAVETAVATMEDCGLFDAGINGSYLTAKGEVEMDAAIMSGKDLSAGSVGMVKDIKNPVNIARLVMQYTDHVMLVSKGVTEFARLFGLETKRERPTLHSLAKYNIYKNNKKKLLKKNGRKIGGYYWTDLALWTITMEPWAQSQLTELEIPLRLFQPEEDGLKCVGGLAIRL